MSIGTKKIQNDASIRKNKLILIIICRRIDNGPKEFKYLIFSYFKTYFQKVIKMFCNNSEFYRDSISQVVNSKINAGEMNQNYQKSIKVKQGLCALAVSTS